VIRSVCLHVYGTMSPLSFRISGNSGTLALFGRSSSVMLKGVGLMSKYIAGLSTNLAHPLTLDWGHVIFLSAQAKWLHRAQRLKKLGQ
jgi:hypothetical protein